MAEEKFIILNLRKDLLKARRGKKASRISKTLREKIQKMYRGKKIAIDKSVNEKIWKRGMKNPPTRLRLKLIVDEEKVRVEIGK